MVLPHLVSPGLMSLTFLANYQQRIWVVVGPFALVLSGFAVASYVAWDTAVFVQFASTSALVGTLLLQSALPPLSTCQLALSLQGDLETRKAHAWHCGR